MFDPQGENEPDHVTEARHLQALRLCQQCPAIVECEQWFDSLRPKDRPLGVIAGRLNIEPTRRRKAS